MRDYELMVILHPELDDNGVRDALHALRDRLAEIGEVRDVALIGRRRLMYPVRKVTQGVYAQYNFSATPEVVEAFKQFLAIDQHERVIRYLLILDEKRDFKLSSQSLSELERRAGEAEAAAAAEAEAAAAAAAAAPAEPEVAAVEEPAAETEAAAAPVAEPVAEEPAEAAAAPEGESA